MDLPPIVRWVMCGLFALACSLLFTQYRPLLPRFFPSRLGSGRVFELKWHFTTFSCAISDAGCVCFPSCVRRTVMAPRLPLHHFLKLPDVFPPRDGFLTQPRPPYLLIFFCRDPVFVSLPLYRESSLALDQSLDSCRGWSRR